MKTSHVSLWKTVVCSQASMVDTARTYHIEEVVVTGSNHTTGRSQLLSVISV